MLLPWACLFSPAGFFPLSRQPLPPTFGGYTTATGRGLFKFFSAAPRCCPETSARRGNSKPPPVFCDGGGSFLLPYSIYCVSAPAPTGERSARPIKLGRAIFCLSGNCFTWNIALIAHVLLFHVEHFQGRGTRQQPIATNHNQSQPIATNRNQ